ncbi:MAG: hypothetical protein ACNI27_03195 [Desulfovibrio sp.]
MSLKILYRGVSENIWLITCSKLIFGDLTGLSGVSYIFPQVRWVLIRLNINGFQKRVFWKIILVLRWNELGEKKHIDMRGPPFSQLYIKQGVFPRAFGQTGSKKIRVGHSLKLKKNNAKTAIWLNQFCHTAGCVIILHLYNLM